MINGLYFLQETSSTLPSIFSEIMRQKGTALNYLAKRETYWAACKQIVENLAICSSKIQSLSLSSWAQLLKNVSFFCNFDILIPFFFMGMIHARNLYDNLDFLPFQMPSNLYLSIYKRFNFLHFLNKHSKIKEK